MTNPTVLNFLVTGGARGIGRGLTRLLLNQGHRVLVLDSNTTELDHVQKTLGQRYSKTVSFERCNLRVPAEIRAAVAKAQSLFDGHLDVLINNAAVTGVIGKSKFADLSLEDWNSSLETNLTAPMLLSQACLPLLRRVEGKRQQGGCIIHMSSTRAHQSEPDSEPYASTKAGLIGLTHSMAVSLAGDGIRVNTVLPGWINVANECKEADEKGTKWEDGLSNNDHEWHLVGRVGRVEDIFNAVSYLIEATFVSGTEMTVAGGVEKKMIYPE